MTGLNDEIPIIVDKITAAVHNHEQMHFFLDAARVVCIFHDLLKKYGNIDNLDITKIMNALPSDYSEYNRERIEGIYHTIMLLGHCHEVV